MKKLLADLLTVSGLLCIAYISEVYEVQVLVLLVLICMAISSWLEVLWMRECTRELDDMRKGL